MKNEKREPVVCTPPSLYTERSENGVKDSIQNKGLPMFQPNFLVHGQTKWSIFRWWELTLWLPEDSAGNGNWSKSHISSFPALCPVFLSFSMLLRPAWCVQDVCAWWPTNLCSLCLILRLTIIINTTPVYNQLQPMINNSRLLTLFNCFKVCLKNGLVGIAATS